MLLAISMVLININITNVTPFVIIYYEPIFKRPNGKLEYSSV